MLSPEARRIGMVFQDYALFPHLQVEQNIAFGLRTLSRGARAARVREMAELVGLSAVLGQFPHELSGGQQQRVALARALAPRPELLLLDEPFSNLDVALRERLSPEVREIIKASAATAVLVTHDQHEAFAMADEIGVMHEGRIQQWDSAYNLYHRPANRFVADFVGQGVFLPAKVLNSRQVEIELGVLEGDIPNACQIGCDACGKGCLTDILLRPDDVIHDDAAPTQAEVVHKAFRGAEILYTLRLASGRKVLALVPSHHNHALGERIGIRLDVDHVVAFQPER
jgi:iron(III) transport system ATP-binding protein